jgi:hypothetical protein
MAVVAWEKYGNNGDMIRSVDELSSSPINYH